jgi:hypothetical protein
VPDRFGPPAEELVCGMLEVVSIGALAGGEDPGMREAVQGGGLDDNSVGGDASEGRWRSGLNFPARDFIRRCRFASGGRAGLPSVKVHGMICADGGVGSRTEIVATFAGADTTGCTNSPMHAVGSSSESSDTTLLDVCISR